MPRARSSVFPPGTEFDRSLPIDFSLRLRKSPAVLEYLNGLATSIIAETQSSQSRSNTKTFNTLDCVLANLLNVHLADPRGFLNASRRSESFNKTQYNKPPASAETFKRVLDYLSQSGLMDFKNGFNDQVTGIGRCAKHRATGDLIQRLSELASGGHGIALSPHAIVRDDRSFEAVRLKDENGSLEEYDETTEATVMRQRLQAWNSYAALHWVDLAISDSDDVFYLTEDRSNGETDEQREDRCQRRGFSLPDFSATRLHRIFNRSSFDFGGRFYGGWWQNIRSEFRPKIMIDGNPTRERDFRSMIINMLYAKEGIEAPIDAYELDELPTKPLKLALIMLINAVEGQSLPHMPSGIPLEWDELTERLRSKHEPIAHYFRSGIGIEMQRRDSDIADIVMIEAAKRNILALPVHDSFIVPHFRVREIEQLMKVAYRTVMQGDIEVSLTPSFVDEFMEQESDLCDETEMASILLSQDCSNYRAREEAFEAHHRERFVSDEEFNHWQSGSYEPVLSRIFGSLPGPPLCNGPSTAQEGLPGVTP